MRSLALLVILTLLLAGCGGVPQEQHFTVADDAPSTTDTHTGDGFDLRVHVTDQNGTPLAGAAVVVFTMNGAFGGSVDAGAEAGEGGARTVAFWEAEFTQYTTIAGLRTNAEGWVQADLEPNKMVHVAAGDVAGLTTEARTNVAINGGGQSGSITVALYPEQISYSFDVVYGNHVGTAGYIMPGPSEAYRIAFHDDATLGKAYTQRIYSLDASTTWTNNLQQGADLHIAIGSDTERPWVGADKQQLVNDGSHTESVTVASSDLDDHRADLAERGYHAHLITDWASLSFDGLDATIDVTATLKGSNIRIN